MSQHPSVMSLSGCDWTFAGYTGEDWRYRNAFVSQEPSRSWHTGTVPGSVHWDLLRAGQLADPYHGLQSLAAEWVSQRQWVYSTRFELTSEPGSRVFLELAGTDYAADVFLGGESLGRSASLFAPSIFEITGRSGEQTLGVVLREAPVEQAQIGYSSQVTTHKPRMSYGWDFAPRLVHVGITGDVRVLTTGSARIDDLGVRATPSADRSSAQVQVEVELDDPDGTATEVRLQVRRGDDEVVEQLVEVPSGATTVQAELHLDAPALWCTNGTGDQPLYSCTASVLTGSSASDTRTTVFGVRSVRLVHNEGPDGPREDALPYTLEVNGERQYIKGWNWVPVDAMFGRPDLSERYEELVELARAAHVNLLRVWGGGLIERELFYDLCDRAGILIWQEFVQSSSGLDNEPPTGSQYLDTLATEARSIVRSRRNHPSLALWCGGNELEAGGRPITSDHQNMAALEAVVRELDPDRPFVPSSPSGPVFYLDEQVVAARPLDQHDVHGPWDYRGPVATYSVYDTSTALFHSEFGVQGAIARSSLNRFIEPEGQWPPDATNEPWLHHGSWWLQRHWIDALFGPVHDMDDYVLLSQWVQADVLGYALDANRRRWPECSGALPWQLNEPWPMAHCTSAVDYYLRPKAAYWAVRDAYARVSPSLRHRGLALDGAPLQASVHVACDDDVTGEVVVTCYDLRGRLLHEQTHAFTGSGSLELGTLELDLQESAAPVAVVRLETRGAFDGSGVRRHYLFSSSGPDATPFASAAAAEPAKLHADAADGVLTLRNDSGSVALFPAVDVDDDSVRWQLSDNAPLLLPGESWSTTVRASRRTQPLGPHAPADPAPSSQPQDVVVTVRGWNVPALDVVVPLASR